MYLAYLDDSDTRQKRHKWQVMSAVLVRDSCFRELEVRMDVMAEILMPAEKLHEFSEFHACEIYGGYGIFEGIEQAKRFAAIQSLLNVVEHTKLPVIYGAVDLERLNSMVYGSADPIDIAFRICARGVEHWMSENGTALLQEQQRSGKFDRDQLFGDSLTLFIADDCNAKSKASMQRSFRKMRTRRFKKKEESGQIRLFVHDDMYFGDSKFSVGIQLADLCSYFIARHLDDSDNDVTAEVFYKLIEPYIVYSQIEPQEKENATETTPTVGS